MAAEANHVSCIANVKVINKVSTVCVFVKTTRYGANPI